MQHHAAERMRERQPPGVQQQTMHAEVDTPQPVVVAPAVAGVANYVMRNMMQMLADLPITPGLGYGFDKGVA